MNCKRFRCPTSLASNVQDTTLAFRKLEHAPNLLMQAFTKMIDNVDVTLEHAEEESAEVPTTTTTTETPENPDGGGRPNGGRPGPGGGGGGGGGRGPGGRNGKRQEAADLIEILQELLSED